MVSRRFSADSSQYLPGPLGIWQKFISRCWRGARDAGRRLYDERASWSSALVRRSPLLLAVIAVTGGQLLSALAATSPISPIASLASFVSLVLWLSIGLAVIWWFEGPPASGPSAVFDASVFGLVPWVIAILPELHAVAWLLSAGVTTWALGRVLSGWRSAARTVAIAWGVQAAVAVLMWILLPAWLLFFAG